jgi:hypothetical protein
MNKTIKLDNSVFASDGTKSHRIVVTEEHNEKQHTHSHDTSNNIADALISAYSYVSLPHIVSVYVYVP